MKIVKHLKWSDKAWIEPLNLFQKPVLLSVATFTISVDGSDEYWWPIEPTDDAVFAYTVYTYDSDAEPCMTTSVNEEESIRANIYPNPAYDHVQVERSGHYRP